MGARSVKVGRKRFRERFGRYFEEFKVGDTYEHRPGRTISGETLKALKALYILFFLIKLKTLEAI